MNRAGAARAARVSATAVASEQYSKKKIKMSHNTKELDGKMKSPHNDMIGGNVTTAGMEDKETSVKKKKRGKFKGGIISKDKGNESGAMNKGNDHEVGEKGYGSSMIMRSNRRKQEEWGYLVFKYVLGVD
jgi:hypothetical protein